MKNLFYVLVVFGGLILWGLTTTGRIMDRGWYILLVTIALVFLAKTWIQTFINMGLGRTVVQKRPY